MIRFSLPRVAAASFLAILALASAAPSHAEATADTPHYEDKALWPDDVEKTAYSKETWPNAPLLVWAQLEKSGAVSDPKKPASWLVDGKPSAVAPDETTDVYFPEGSFIRVQGHTALRVRHVTVGSGVVIKAVSFRPSGNVWIKEKGRIGPTGLFTGEKNTFLRNDNKNFGSQFTTIENKVMFNKAKDASVEIIGVARTNDELSVLSGTLIVGPNAELTPGNRSIQNVYPGARLILMSGSKYHKRGNQRWMTDLVVAGELLAGTPERPLTKDCTLGLSHKWKGRTEDKSNRGGGASDYGMVIRPDGTIRVTSADPKTARLVITWNGLQDEIGDTDGSVPSKEDKKVDIVLQGNVSLEGVMFDHIMKEGILMPDPESRKSWVAEYGPKNEGTPDELFRKIDKPINPKLSVSMASVPTPYSEQTEEQRKANQNMK